MAKANDASYPLFPRNIGNNINLATAPFFKSPLPRFHLLLFSFATAPTLFLVITTPAPSSPLPSFPQISLVLARRYLVGAIALPFCLHPIVYSTVLHLPFHTTRLPPC